MSIFNLFFESNYKSRARRDQRSVGTSFKNLVSPFNSYGKCFSCDGLGYKTFDCKSCGGTGDYSGTCSLCERSGTFAIPSKPCYSCHGRGVFRNTKCLRCSGSGERQVASVVPCKKCSGIGTFSASCKKCSGCGHLTISCRKCSGSGWHRF